jgi:hypothetical protein
MAWANVDQDGLDSPTVTQKTFVNRPRRRDVARTATTASQSNAGSASQDSGSEMPDVPPPIVAKTSSFGSAGNKKS